MLHLPELVLPVSGKFRRGDLSDAKVLEREHQRERLGGWLQFAPDAVQVILEDEPLDDGGARGRCSEPLLAHGLAKVLILDELACALHRRKQSGLGEARRWPGLGGPQFDPLCPHLGAVQGGKRNSLIARLRFPPVDGEPAGVVHNAPVTAKRFSLDTSNAGCDHEFGGWKEHSEKPLDHHVVELPLDLVELPRGLEGRNNGKVVGDLGIVENALVRPHPPLLEDLRRKWRVSGEESAGLAALSASQHRLRRADRGDVVLWQCAGIGSRIGENLVLLVERLRERKRHFGRETEATVRLALEAGKVEQQWRNLRGW